MSGFVYAIADGTGRVKIGWSTDPLRRLAKIRSDCPTTARLIGLIPATRSQEKEAHDLLAPWRVNREWFRLEGPALAFVEMLPKPQPRPARSNHPLDAWLAANRKTRVWLADKTGTTEASLSRIINGKQWPGQPFFKRLRKITGITPNDVLIAERVA